MARESGNLLHLSFFHIKMDYGIRLISINDYKKSSYFEVTRHLSSLFFFFPFMFLVHFCSPALPKMILERTGACIIISSKAESLFWRAEVLSSIGHPIHMRAKQNFLCILNCCLHLWSMQRLFFLNGDQDLSSFLLADLGIVKYPTYNCIVTEQLFSDRNDLLAYEEVELYLFIYFQNFCTDKYGKFYCLNHM